MSLSQNDFRKLLATPRAPPPGSASDAQKPKFAKPLPKKPQAEFARPVPAKFRKKPAEGEEDGNGDGSDSTKFRDRAAERRMGKNKDYADSEQIIARLTATEASETTLYEQSKFLGGDVEHTHLVKGLDFALLRKVRSEMKQSSENNGEENPDEFLNRVEKQSVAPTSTKTAESSSTAPTFNSTLAERIHNIAIQSNSTLPLKNDLFSAGRMAFCWDLRTGDDIPTTIIRSKAEVKNEVKSSTADSEIVIGKIIEILASVRFGTRTKEAGMTVGEKKMLQKKNQEEKAKKEALERQIMTEDGSVVIVEDDGDDIFAEVGRDYSFDVAVKATTEPEKSTSLKPLPSNPLKSTTYFAKPVIDSDDEDEGAPTDKIMTEAGGTSIDHGGNPDDDEDDMFADLDAKKPKTTTAPATNTLDSLLSTSAAMLNTLQGAGTAEKILTSSQTAQSKKPNGMSLAARLSKSNYGEEDPEFDQYYDSDDMDEEEEAAADASQLDLGIKARKKSQLKRFDFDTEEEFQRYKESQVVMPKSAYQFGVKSKEGRKNRKELSGGGKGGGTQDQKLDKELKQLEKMMGEKYGEGKGKKREAGGSASSAGGPPKRQR
ncbi:RED-like protein N-terminal region-domain-containing protein [Obelidium mucronatum]|nr:RED-like protein N-terminal region-domain-containing protein [Obelidium mucronatum]